MSSDIVDIDINFDNAVDNLYRYIDNLKQDPRHNKALVEEYGRKLLYYVNKYPYIIKAFSDDPAGLEFARQETLRRIAAIKAKGTTSWTLVNLRDIMTTY